MSTTVPNLLFPARVVIEQTDQDKVVYDHRSREPRNFIPRKSSFVIEAQIVWEESLSARSMPFAEASGVEDRTLGHIIVRHKDIRKLGKTLQVNDKITKMGGQLVTYYVQKVIPGSHYNGVATLYKVVFTDRRGTR